MVAVGIALLPQERWVSARRKWEQVEEWGFDHAWTYDHLAWRTLVDEPWFATVPLLAAAAAVTERIGLGHVGGVAELPAPGARSPRTCMGLDDVSDGRFLLGLGAGGEGFDASVLGDPPTRGRADAPVRGVRRAARRAADAPGHRRTRARSTGPTRRG